MQFFTEEEAQALDALRARHESQFDHRFDGGDTHPLAGIAQQCACGNVLTIEDRGTTCRQCVLARRVHG